MNLDEERLAKWVADTWKSGPPDDGRRVWTRYFNSCLADLATKQQPALTAHYSNRDEDRCEYMIDRCWSAPWSEMRTYSGLVLAAEFEWGGSRKDIEEDLVKLADVRAQHRVFVGNLSGPGWSANADHIAESAADFLRDHRFATERDSIVLGIGPKQGSAQNEPIRVWIVRPGCAEPFLASSR